MTIQRRRGQRLEKLEFIFNDFNCVDLFGTPNGSKNVPKLNMQRRRSNPNEIRKITVVVLVS